MQNKAESHVESAFKVLNRALNGSAVSAPCAVDRFRSAVPAVYPIASATLKKAL
jgi:hypothetical protein